VGRGSGFWLTIRVHREARILRCTIRWVEEHLDVCSVGIIPAELFFISGHWLMFPWMGNI